MYQAYDDGTQGMIQNLEYYINVRDVENSVRYAQELSKKLVVLSITVTGFEQETIAPFTALLPTQNAPMVIYPPNANIATMNPMQNSRSMPNPGIPRFPVSPMPPPGNSMAPPGNPMAPPGNSVPTPRNYMASPGNSMPPPGNSNAPRGLMPGGNLGAPPNYSIPPGNPVAMNPPGQGSRSTNNSGGYYDPTILLPSGANQRVNPPASGVNSYAGPGQVPYGSGNQPRQPMNPQSNPSNHIEKQSWITELITAGYQQNVAVSMVESCNSRDELIRKLNGN